MDADAWRHFTDRWTVEARTGWRLRRYATGDVVHDVAVALPQADPPPAGFPLLVVTDGALHFDAAATAAAALARRPLKTGVQPTVVVGIASGAGWSHDAARRARELVPEGADADALLALIRDRIVPDVAALAPLDAAATAILGHSLGGLFALHALAHATFATCIAVSPSLWRLPGLVDAVAPALTSALTGRDARVLLASGDREPARGPTLAEAAARLGQVARVERVLLAGEDHGSIPFAVLPAALRFVHAGR